MEWIREGNLPGIVEMQWQTGRLDCRVDLLECRNNSWARSFWPILGICNLGILYPPGVRIYIRSRTERERDPLFRRIFTGQCPSFHQIPPIPARGVCIPYTIHARGLTSPYMLVYATGQWYIYIKVAALWIFEFPHSPSKSSKNKEGKMSEILFSQ